MQSEALTSGQHLPCQWRLLTFCGEPLPQLFSSVEGFDRHRVGKHEYTYSEGLKFDPPVEDGRRCLYVHEMEGLGLSLDKNNRWSDPTKNPGGRLRARHKHTEGVL